jgi:hypothetical protein
LSLVGITALFKVAWEGKFNVYFALLLLASFFVRAHMVTMVSKWSSGQTFGFDGQNDKTPSSWETHKKLLESLCKN